MKGRASKRAGQRTTEREKEREKEILYPLAHYPNALNSKDRTRARQEPRTLCCSITISGRAPHTWAIPGTTESWIRTGTVMWVTAA